MPEIAKKTKTWIIILTIIAGLIATVVTYFNTEGVGDVATITGNIVDKLDTKTEDAYQNHDQKRIQIIHLTILSGKHKNKTYVVKNYYAPSQLTTQKYRSHERVLVSFNQNQPNLLSPKRDWILGLTLTILLALMIMITGKHSIFLILSMILNWILFFMVIYFDVKENGTQTFLIYGLAALVFAFVSLVLVQGFNKKMLATFIATILGVFVSFGLCYIVMRLTHESGMKYETVDYATQNPRSLFLAQSILGVLGAVMDEATDIVSSLAMLAKTKTDLTYKQLWKSGRTMGQEIMGPLINVLVLIFMAEALPMSILYLRDNNTLSSTFQFTLSLGAVQSAISAIGIVLTVIFATVCSFIFLHKNEVNK